MTNYLYATADIAVIRDMNDQELIEHLYQLLDQVEPKVLAFIKKYQELCATVAVVDGFASPRYLDVPITTLLGGLDSSEITEIRQRLQLSLSLDPKFCIGKTGGRPHALEAFELKCLYSKEVLGVEIIVIEPTLKSFQTSYAPSSAN